MALSGPLDTGTQGDFRQLHASRLVAAELERRVLLTAQISDALFGLTQEPGPFAERLQALCQAVLELASECDQHLALTCDVQGTLPDVHAEPTLRVAHEFVGNAVKYGMRLRLIGRIEVLVVSDADGMVLEVRDDGWDWGCGCGRAASDGEALALARLLATAHDGRITQERRAERTVARLILPTLHHA